MSDSFVGNISENTQLSSQLIGVKIVCNAFLYKVFFLGGGIQMLRTKVNERIKEKNQIYERQIHKS